MWKKNVYDVLFTIFSPICFGRYRDRLQCDIIITTIQRYRSFVIWSADIQVCASLLISTLFYLGGLPTQPQNPHFWRTSLSLLVWPLSYGLSGLGCPTRNIKKEWTKNGQHQTPETRLKLQTSSLLSSVRFSSHFISVICLFAPLAVKTLNYSTV